MGSSSAAAEHNHELRFLLTDGEVDLQDVSTADLTRLVAAFLGVLAERKEAEQQ